MNADTWEAKNMKKHVDRLKECFGSNWSKAVCALLAALMFAVVNVPAVISASGTARQLPIYCVQRDQQVVSLSFDAAWGDVRVRSMVSGE